MTTITDMPVIADALVKLPGVTDVQVLPNGFIDATVTLKGVATTGVLLGEGHLGPRFLEAAKTLETKEVPGGPAFF